MKVGELNSVRSIVEALGNVDPDKPLVTRHLPIDDMEGYADDGEPMLSDPYHNDQGLHLFGVFDMGEYVVLAMT